MTHSSQSAGAAPVTLINVFEVPAGHVDAFIAQWRERAALMAAKPGFLDTQLHRALSAGARFQLVNVAHWESQEAWQAASADPQFQQRARAAIADSQQVSANPAIYEVVARFPGSLPGEDDQATSGDYPAEDGTA